MPESLLSTSWQRFVCHYRVVNDLRCGLCGRPLSTHDRHVRFRLPQPVLDGPGHDLPPGTWLSHGTAEESVMMQVPHAGPFVRALLPVRLAGGYTVTFGVWAAIRPGDLQRAPCTAVGRGCVFSPAKAFRASAWGSF